MWTGGGLAFVSTSCVLKASHSTTESCRDLSNADGWPKPLHGTSDDVTATGQRNAIVLSMRAKRVKPRLAPTKPQAAKLPASTQQCVGLWHDSGVCQALVPTVVESDSLTKLEGLNLHMADIALFDTNYLNKKGGGQSSSQLPHPCKTPIIMHMLCKYVQHHVHAAGHAHCTCPCF
eukprot:2744459-Amphidinium_carterae.1